MAFTNTNDQLTGRVPAPYPAGAELLAVRATLALATGDLVANTTGAVMFLPAGCVPVDVYVDGTDLDAGAAAMVLQVGICNAGVTDLSAAAADGGGFWGATVAVNAAFQQRIVPNLQCMVNTQPASVDRKVGVKVLTAPTTPAAGTVGVTLFYRSV